MTGSKLLLAYLQVISICTEFEAGFKSFRPVAIDHDHDHEPSSQSASAA